MGQNQSTSSTPASRGARRVDWWEALKLATITAAVGGLQWLKFALLTIEDEQHSSQRHGRHQSNRERPTEKPALSRETRRALVNLIDYQLTPLLVDQWRVNLVKVMLDPEEGPVLPQTEEDSYIRQGILDSLKTYQEAQSRRRTFREGAAPAPSALPRIGQPGPFRPAERRQQPTASTSSRVPGQVLSEHRAAASTSSRPSAPPLYPTVQHPSAPPLTELDQTPASTEPEPEDCGICMDASVEVQIEGCGHQMCCECATAICCLEDRAPQCPFCRGPMNGVAAINL